MKHNPIAYKVGDRIQHAQTGAIGIVRQLRRHEPVHIGVAWQNGNGFEWVQPQSIRAEAKQPC